MHWTCCDTTSFSQKEIQKAYEGLTPSRKVYIDSLRQPKDKIRSLTGDLLARQLLAQHYGIHSARLHRKENGQPYFTGSDLYVSLSHCGEKVACAVSQTPVGIDLERIRPVNLKLCRHVCVPEERDYVLGDYQELEDRECQDLEVLKRFFEVWTAKEAYFKKCGTGITDLKSVNILPMPRKIFMVEDYMVQIL